MDQDKCSIDGCPKGGKLKRGWCVGHYTRWHRYGDPLGVAPAKPARVCVIEDCGRQHSARGWCDMHYLRWRLYGDPLFAGDIYSDLPDETWLPVPGFEGFYDVSDLGRVRSLPRQRTRGCILKQHPVGVDRRMQVTLSREGAVSSKMVHRLVGEAFLGPMPEGLETRHLDGNCRNNAAYNLKYGTHAENMADQILHGTNWNANKTHCPKKHPYEGGNLYVIPSSGGRICRTCARDASRVHQGYTGRGRWPKKESAA